MLTKRDFLRSTALATAALATTRSIPAVAQTGLTPAEVRAIAKEQGWTFGKTTTENMERAQGGSLPESL